MTSESYHYLPLRSSIIHCGGQEGFIEDALFITHNSMVDASADFHGTINATIFEKWFENSILKRLQEPSMIVCVMPHITVES
ncbi:hypothetical protein ANN_04616 [Periplaneta americana]|uniref:Uncharacterized protein n=1 Tax=Periplaneta americana TaxID=6978 RepID=A0ABQ8TAL1_PERAM|nr:hypothetical protein ANN_04616 [Periplaneta americana]